LPVGTDDVAGDAVSSRPGPGPWTSSTCTVCLVLGVVARTTARWQLAVIKRRHYCVRFRGLVSQGPFVCYKRDHKHLLDSWSDRYGN
jgi:hypothetical protein